VMTWEALLSTWLWRVLLHTVKARYHQLQHPHQTRVQVHQVWHG